MILKGRLKLLYDMIPTCDILSDIGTDHALLPAYALINGKCKKTIACDVRKGPLDRAQKTVNKYKLNDNMELRLGNGLDPILEKEADCIVIAGMGGHLIIQILNCSMDKAKHANTIILQPMTRQELIRPFLWQHGFEVLDEALTHEGEKLYQVIKISYTGLIRKKWEPIDEIIGEKLIKKKDPILKNWIKAAITRQEKVVNGVIKSKVASQCIDDDKKLLDKLGELLNDCYSN